MYRFLLYPRWLLGHALVLAVIATCVVLGLWQLQRLGERRTVSRLVTERTNLPAQEIGALLDAWSHEKPPTYRRVTAEGVFDRDREMILLGRSLEGRPGQHVLTPLLTDEGTAVIVDRGWVPLADGRLPPGSTAPEGRVSITGVLLASERPGRFGPTQPKETKVLGLVDLELLGRRLPYPIYPLYLRLEDQNPQQSGDLPVLVPLPKPDEGPHLSYAVQWFLFASVALIGYGALVRKAANTALLKHLGNTC